MINYEAHCGKGNLENLIYQHNPLIYIGCRKEVGRHIHLYFAKVINASSALVNPAHKHSGKQTSKTRKINELYSDSKCNYRLLFCYARRRASFRLSLNIHYEKSCRLMDKLFRFKSATKRILCCSAMSKRIILAKLKYTL